MFKSLKKRLLIVNMITILVLLTIAFSSIYFITFNNTNRDIDKMIHQISTMKPPEAKNFFDNDFVRPPEDFISKERQIAFVINFKDENDILSIDAFFNVTDEFYDNVTSIADDIQDEEGRIKFDDTTWAYKRVQRSDFYQIFFVDVSKQLELLNKLVYTFLFVSLTMLLLTYFSSSYLTNQSLKPIKEAFRKQNQFISDASHELKTPLAVINTNVDVLKNSDEDPAKWLNYIQTEVGRMSQLTESLLYLSQFDHQKDITESVNLSELAEHTSLGLEAFAYEEQIEFIQDIQENIQTKGHGDQLTQLMMILLDNAMKYSDAQGYVSFKLSQTNHHIYIEVKNNGSGIPEKDLPYIFDRFYKVDHSRHHTSKSYGLGLSIAFAIVKAHHGKIIVNSQENGLTSFLVKLPI